MAGQGFDLIRELVRVGLPIGRIDYSGFDTEHVGL